MVARNQTHHIGVRAHHYNASMTTKRRAKSAQLTLDDARKPTGRGGWRPNAGRPKGRRSVAHEVRAGFSGRIPQHVTLRLVRGLPSMRDEWIVGLLRTQIALSHRADFRVIEFCVQRDHMHFIVEADGCASLTKGVTGLEVRIARRINRALQRTGDFFEERYHVRPLATPREVRNALRYVLNNERHHASTPIAARWLDPFSSAPWFSGWSEPVAHSTLPEWLCALPRPTMPATVWLLTTGWKKHGLIAFDEVPAMQRLRRGRRG
jgi:putative transposase